MPIGCCDEDKLKEGMLLDDKMKTFRCIKLNIVG